MKFKIDIRELQKQSLFVATPMFGGMCHGTYSKSIAELSIFCAQHGIEMRLYYLFNESLVTRARNYCCDEFLRAKTLEKKNDEGEVVEEPKSFTHMLFIDADISFNPQDVIAMLALQIQNDEYDIISAPYPKKCITWEKIKAAVDKGFADEDPNELEKMVGDFVFNPVHGASIRLDEPAEVQETGTGFMMIRRDVFEKYEEFYPEYWYKPDHVRTKNFDGSREIMAFFDCYIDKDRRESELQEIVEAAASDKIDKVMIDKAKDILKREENSSKRYLSEDYMFCQNVRKMGMKIWLCPWMHLSHAGFYMFDGSLPAIASIGQSATADPSILKHKK